MAARAPIWSTLNLSHSFLQCCSPDIPLPICTCAWHESIPGEVGWHSNLLIVQCSNTSKFLCKALCPTYQRIIENFGLEGTPNTILSMPPPCVGRIPNISSKLFNSASNFCTQIIDKNPDLNPEECWFCQLSVRCSPIPYILSPDHKPVLHPMQLVESR